MTSMRFLCFSALAVVAAGVVNSRTDGVIRRMTRTTRHKTSAFEGLHRTDRYSFHRGLNCSAGHGGNEIDAAELVPMGKTLEQCQKICASDDGCTCITHVPSTGRCGKHRACYVESCVPSLLADTYMQHSTFGVRRNSASTGLSHVEDGAERWLNGMIRDLSDPVYSLYDRNGGWECNNANVTNIGDSSNFQMVKECLDKCERQSGCKCVQYERVQEAGAQCVLQGSGCRQQTPEGTQILHSGNCARSDDHDTYVRMRV